MEKKSSFTNQIINIYKFTTNSHFQDYYYHHHHYPQKRNESTYKHLEESHWSGREDKTRKVNEWKLDASLWEEKEIGVGQNKKESIKIFWIPFHLYNY